MKTAFELIAEEKQKQINKGYDSAHDDSHNKGELAEAAAYYAFTQEQREWTDKMLENTNGGEGSSVYPFEPESFKPYPNDRIHELVISCSFLIAEIERRQRIKK